MFENTSAKIKSVATILVIVGVVVAVLIGFGLLIALIEVSDSAVGPFFISAIATVSISLISYVSALLIYGFGDIVYSCAKTADAQNTKAYSKPSITTEQLDRLIAAKNDHIISEETFEKILIATATFDNIESPYVSNDPKVSNKEPFNADEKTSADSVVTKSSEKVQQTKPIPIDGNTITCAKCGYNQNGWRKVCFHCGYKFEASTEERNAYDVDINAAHIAIDDTEKEWVCENCNAKNDFSELYCLSCGAYKFDKTVRL